MPQQIIDVPGVGPVEFPDGMSDADIAAAAARLHAEATSTTPAWRPAPPVAEPLPESARWRPTREQAIEMMLTEARMPIVDPSSTAARVIRDTAMFAVPASAVARGVSAIPAVARMGRTAQALTHAGTQAPTAFAVDTVRRGEISADSAVPAVVAGTMPMVGAGLQAGARRLMGSALESGLKDVASTYNITRTGRLIERPKSLTGPLTPERLNETRRLLTDSALTHRITGTRTPQALPSDPQRFAARILANRPTTPLPWWEFAGYTGGAWASGQPSLKVLAALLSGARAVATAQPARTAIALNEVGRGVSAGAGVGAGLAASAQEPRLTPAQAEMVRELLKRETAR